MEGKYVVAAMGIAGAVILGSVNLVMKGPDSTITAAVIGAITFIAGLAFGYKVSEK